MQDPTHSIETLLEHRSWVSALARAVALDPEAAQDLEQETWLRALEKPPKVRRAGQTGSLRGWLHEVLHSRNTDAARKRGREGVNRERLGREVDETGASPRRRRTGLPDEDALRHETFRALAEAVAALPAPYSETIWLRFIEELDVTAVAERLGATASNVHTWTHRGLEQLRERLESKLGDDWRQRCVVLALPGALLGMGTAGLGGILLAGLFVCAASAAVFGLYRWQQAHEFTDVRIATAIVEPVELPATQAPAKSPQRSDDDRTALAPENAAAPTPQAPGTTPLPVAATIADAPPSGSASLTVRIVNEDGQPRLGEDWQVQYLSLGALKAGKGPSVDGVKMGRKEVDEGTGEARFPALPSGLVNVTASNKKRTQTPHAGERIVLVEGQVNHLDLKVVGPLLDWIGFHYELDGGFPMPDPAFLTLIRPDGSKQTAAEALDADALARGSSPQRGLGPKFTCTTEGPFAVTLEDPAYEPVRLEGLAVNTNHLLQLVPSGRLRLRVRDSVGGELVPFRAHLARVGKFNPFRVSATSEPVGGEPLAVVPITPGEYRVSVAIEDLPVFQVTLDLSALSGSALANREITAPAVRTLTGNVVDDLGRVQAGVSVAAMLPAAEKDGPVSHASNFEQLSEANNTKIRTVVATVQTDDEGRFEFAALTSQPVVLQAFVGRNGSQGTPVDGRCSTLTEPFVLARRGVVFGELGPLILRGGVVGQSIWATPIELLGALTRFRGGRAPRIGFSGVPGLGSKFEIDLPPGRWMLCQHEDNEKRARIQVRQLGEVEVRSGERTEFLATDPNAERVSLVVLCRDSLNRPLMGRVFLRGENWSGAEMARRDGKATFVGLEPGSYKVKFRDADSSVPPAPDFPTVAMTARSQELMLTVPARLFGELSVRAEGHLADAATLVRVTGVGRYRAVPNEIPTGNDGVCHFAKLDVGTYIVTARDAAGQWIAAQSSPVVVEAGQLTSVTFDCHVMSGRVQCMDGQSGEPRRNQLVNLWHGTRPERNSHSLQTDAEGFIDARLTPGEWSFYVGSDRRKAVVLSWPPSGPLKL